MARQKPFLQLVLDKVSRKDNSQESLREFEHNLSSERQVSPSKRKERFQSLVDYEQNHSAKRQPLRYEPVSLPPEERENRYRKITRAETQSWDSRYILMINLRKFISKLKLAAVVQNDRWLKPAYSSQIGDVSDGTQSDCSLKRKYKTFRPDSGVNNVRRHVQLLSLLSAVFYYPLIVAFSWETRWEYVVVLVVLESLDIYFQLFTGIYVSGVYVEDTQVIWSHYLPWPLLQDTLLLCARLCTMLLAPGDSCSLLLRLSILCRLPLLQNTYQTVTERLRRQDSSRGVAQLVQLLLMVLVLSHLAACLMIYVAYSQTGGTWLSESPIVIQQGRWEEVYILAMYWAIVTLTTVGYGDISPVTVLEVVIASLTVLLGSAIFAFFMNSVGLILGDMSRADRQFQHQLDLVNNYMSANHIDSHLQGRVRQYLRHVLKVENATRVEEERRSILQLDARIKEDVIIQTNARVVHKCDLLMNSFSESTLRALVLGLSSHRLLPGDSIHLGTQQDVRFYFIDKGRIDLTLPHQPENPLCEMRVGEHFNQKAFFTGQTEHQTVISRAFSTLFSISRDAFLAIVTLVPEDRQKFMMLADRLTMGDHRVLNTHCATCSSRNHPVWQCPSVHYVPDREKTLKKYLFPHDQKRQVFQRRGAKSFNSRGIQQELSLISKYYFQPDGPVSMEDICEQTEYSSEQSSPRSLPRVRPSLVMNRKHSFASTQNVINGLSQESNHLQQMLIQYQASLNREKRESERREPAANQGLLDEIADLKRQLQESRLKHTHSSLLQSSQNTHVEIDGIKSYSLYFPHNNFSAVQAQYTDFCQIRQKATYQQKTQDLYRKLNYANQLYEFKDEKKAGGKESIKRTSTSDKVSKDKFTLKRESDVKEEFDFKKMMSEVKKGG